MTTYVASCPQTHTQKHKNSHINITSRVIQDVTSHGDYMSSMHARIYTYTLPLEFYHEKKKENK